MKSIYETRFRENMANNTKYLKYVFNDHFVIILFIAIGYVTYLYSQNLAFITSLNPLLIRLVIAVVFLLELSSFNFVTFLKEADQIFLLPVISKLKGVYKTATVYSMVLPTLTYGLTVISAYPVLSEFDIHFKLLSSLILFNSLLLMQLIKFNLFKLEIEGKSSKKGRYVLLAYEFVFLVLFSFNQVIWLLLSTILFWFLLKVYDRFKNHGFFQVRLAIEAEKKRQNRIYRFYSLFIDLPETEVVVKRRHYLDFLKSKTSFKGNLFLLTFLRSGAYLGLFTRLLLINSIITVLLRSNFLAMILSFVFLYLFLFQLGPIYREITESFWSRVFPVPRSNWLETFQKEILKIGILYVVIVSLVMLISGFRNWYNAIIYLGGGIIFTVLVTKKFIIRTQVKVQKD